ncbi:MAG TPA: hypothetical protein VGZ93_06680 [Candidatus Methylacidiphilales bacterium]|jgi:hypothetical protein|nr:hypothetical protein [Candidatus Methylacidiphilales bacterium]
MPRRVIIGVGIASYPLHAAGNTWAFLQWVLGFRQAGWDVWMVEDVPSSKCIDANGQKCAPALSANLAHWNAVKNEFGLEGRATLLFDGRSEELPGLVGFARDAEFLFNISGHFKHGDVLAAAREKIYLDIDPAFTQIWAEIYKSDMNLDGHDKFVSIGRHLGKKGCRAPLAGRAWLPAGVPVVLDYFTNPNAEQPGDVWTTFTHWYGYPQVEYDGMWYGNKSEEFARLADLPKKTGEKLEIATDLHPEDQATRQFLEGGWRLVDARPLNTPWRRYRDYLAQSRGEFCVAKNGYVRSRCGWFSDRSVAYLALGRPVILQETGWTDFYPHGEGLLAFHDEESARNALETVAKDPVKHGRAARRIAETHCSAPVVLNQLLETIGRAR